MTGLKITTRQPDEKKYKSILIYSLSGNTMRDIMILIDRECIKENIPSKWLLLYVDNYNRIDVYIKAKYYDKVIK